MSPTTYASLYVAKKATYGNPKPPRRPDLPMLIFFLICVLALLILFLIHQNRKHVRSTVQEAAHATQAL